MHLLYIKKQCHYYNNLKKSVMRERAQSIRFDASDEAIFHYETGASRFIAVVSGW